jgi:hypothetical protein
MAGHSGQAARVDDLCYRIKFIDTPSGGMNGFSSRDVRMFRKIEGEIFEKDEKRKGKPLGLLLDEYTSGPLGKAMLPGHKDTLRQLILNIL